ncbi:unnamed protein product [Lasius platythorax]|uniref:Uncharacterized protein n=1 Tax=Lasius platythorax TaxID=488582 RepID=A0AAV2P681_9HYME
MIRFLPQDPNGTIGILGKIPPRSHEDPHRIRLSSPRFHARQLKSLINMQREPGEEKTCRGDDRPADAKKRKKEEILGKER